mgnify:CR=1 FL=1
MPSVFFAIGMGIYSPFGYYFPDWRVQCQILGPIMIIYPLCQLIVPKSFQSAFARGRTAEGHKLLDEYSKKLNIILDPKVHENYEEVFQVSNRNNFDDSECISRPKSMLLLTINLSTIFFCFSLLYATYLWKPDGMTPFILGGQNCCTG